MIVQPRRMVRQIAVALEMKVLEVLARQLSGAGWRAQDHLPVGASPPPQVDLRHLPEEPHGAADQASGTLAQFMGHPVLACSAVGPGPHREGTRLRKKGLPW